MRDAERSGVTVAPALCAGSDNRILAGKIVLFVGNLVRVKGPDLLIEAWKLLYSRRVAGTDAARSEAIEEQELRCSSRRVAGTDAAHSEVLRAQELRCSSRRVAGTDAAHSAATTREVGEPRSGYPALVVIGDGSMLSELERRARQYGLAESVTFLGVRAHDEIALWMNRADVLCLTSRSEGMPNVILEALASGLPVVATDVGACREMLEGEPGARIVKPGDAEALASTISELLELDVDRKAMAERHGKRSWDAMAREILENMGVIEGALNRGSER